VCGGLGAGRLLHVNIEWAAILSWNHVDGIIRIKNRRDSPDVNFMHWNMSDEVSPVLSELFTLLACSLVGKS